MTRYFPKIAEQSLECGAPAPLFRAKRVPVGTADIPADRVGVPAHIVRAVLALSERNKHSLRRGSLDTLHAPDGSEDRGQGDCETHLPQNP